jgi:hypothetical protein
MRFTVLPPEDLLLIIKDLNISKYKILMINQILVSLINSITFVTAAFSSDSEFYNSFVEALKGAKLKMFPKSL